MTTIKYAHTNIIARDWRKLAEFYIDVFKCQPLDPERDLQGDWIDRATAIKNVRIRGIHLRLPGYEDGPTLEIFEYSPEEAALATKRINSLGFGHIAFLVDNVEEVLEKLLARGGSKLGEIVQKEYEGLTMVYARDPEGNFIEIQNWGR